MLESRITDKFECGEFPNILSKDKFEKKFLIVPLNITHSLNKSPIHWYTSNMWKLSHAGIQKQE